VILPLIFIKEWEFLGRSLNWLKSTKISFSSFVFTLTNCFGRENQKKSDNGFDSRSLSISFFFQSTNWKWPCFFYSSQMGQSNESNFFRLLVGQFNELSHNRNCSLNAFISNIFLLKYLQCFFIKLNIKYVFT
jgi:hypothetical protein